MEFHVSRDARARYGIDDSLFTLTGNVILPDFRATRLLASRMNERRGAAVDPARTVQAGSLNAMGLIDEILHEVIRLYREQRDPAAMRDAVAALEAALGRAPVATLLRTFVERFPPVTVHRAEQTADAYLESSTGQVPNREIALEELLLLWLANANPAFAPFRELFDDTALADTTAYSAAIAELGRFFEGRPPFGPENLDLITLLRRPAVMAPDSLAAQLGYLRQNWGMLLSAFMGRLVVTLDVLREDERAMFLRFAGNTGGPGRGHGGPGLGGGAGGGEDVEYERFSEDRDWMPRVVLLAKSTYVWLDQLSKSYARDIHRLDQIPDEELDTIARWGITGLWLIGLWERSRASQRIKQMRGNPDAVASAYSLRDYAIAEDLGGWQAYDELRTRAAARGIRLASDMVPNHMGIDSTWVMNHPDRFLSLPYSPYPSYRFDGPDLSDDPRVGIFIEDHYFDSTDAAVVFRRLDRGTGQERYIYHGNDGTSMPWNDTAQLDYSRADVREAVIQTILSVARLFPIIRFDAAMTLARRHVERLWFPLPGQGGAIPSRAEHAMTQEEFDRAMPEEFWREVVDRVAAEVPDTLLLAEAFWLLEGYFVRTLGMHRVYNSAFMHMLRDEDNAGYRKVMKDTLEFDPEILKRYVNFMSNPDEATAIEQFATGDKYFGVATLLVTMPGLPMFGHGQVEGYSEKYGMEYRRAYRDERPNVGLIAEHERRLFPLVHRRRIFAEVRDFLLYDVVTADGSVDENVFAYSNRTDGERALVVYHNRFGSTRGRIHDSVAFAEKDASGEKRLIRRTLAEGLGVPGDGEADLFLVARDLVSGLEYLRDTPTIRESGWEVELDAYRTLVLVDWREQRDTAKHELAQLAYRMGLGGVPSVEEALRDLRLEPLHSAAGRFLNAGVIHWLMDEAAARRAVPETASPAGVSRRDDGRDAETEAEAHRRSAGPTEPFEPALEPLAPAGAEAAPARDADASRLLLEDLERQIAGMLEGVGSATERSLDAAGVSALAVRARDQLAVAIRASQARGAPGTEARGEPQGAAGLPAVAEPAAEPAAAGAPAVQREASAEPATVAEPAVPAEPAVEPEPAGEPETLADRDAPVTAAGTDPAGADSEAWAALRSALRPVPSTWGPLVGWISMSAIGQVIAPDSVAAGSRAWFDEAGFGTYLHRLFLDLGLDDGAAWYAVDTVRLLLALPGAEVLDAPPEERPARLVYAWFQDDAMATHLGVNRYEGVSWFNREAFGEALDWLLVVVALTGRGSLGAATRLVAGLAEAAEGAGYQVGRLLELVRS